MHPSMNLKPQRPKWVTLSYRLLTTILAAVVLTLPVACGSLLPVPTPTPPSLAEELIFYDWEEDMPQSILDAFTEEYGIKIIYLTYEDQNEAAANIRAGEVYDVVVFDNDFIPQLVAEGLLAEIDYSNVTNFKNISANFRNLAYDPDNVHSIPFNWGTSGLVVRSDLVEEPITHWRDLWDPRYAGRIAMRMEYREGLAVPLKALGYSINSEDPDELEAALEYLLELKQPPVFVGETAEEALPLLLSGDVIILVGWAEDVLLSREENEAITYVLPAEGAMLWGDNFTIPANSPNKYTAELFLDFLLRPEISAQIVNENYYAIANKAAIPFIEPEILNDSVIFPPNESLTNSEVYLPLSLEIEKLYVETWTRFMVIEP